MAGARYSDRIPSSSEWKIQVNPESSFYNFLLTSFLGPSLILRSSTHFSLSISALLGRLNSNKPSFVSLTARRGSVPLLPPTRRRSNERNSCAGTKAPPLLRLSGTRLVVPTSSLLSSKRRRANPPHTMILSTRQHREIAVSLGQPSSNKSSYTS